MNTPPNSRHPALYYDGRIARAQPATAEFTSEGISIFDGNDGLIARWPADDIVLVEKPRHGDPLRIGPEGSTARLIVEDRQALHALTASAPRASRGVRADRRTLARTAGWAVAAIAGIAATAFVLIPLLAVQLAAMTPDSIKQRVGEATLQRLAFLASHRADGSEAGVFCDDSGGLSALETLARRISAGMEPPPRLRLAVIDAGFVNAFALPGGYVVFTKGLLTTAETPAEIAGVLAHEIGHVVHDHATQAVYRTTAVSMLVSALIGDVTSGVVGGLAEFAINGRYSREAEREADRFAFERLDAAGIDGRGLARFFERIARKADSEDHALFRILSTHPPTRERLDHARTHTRYVGIPLGNAEWRKLRAVCTSVGSEPRLAELP